MSSFDEYRKKLTGKYGSKTEDEQEKKPIDGASVWDDPFETTKKEMTSRYGGGMDSSKVKDWFTESESTLKSMSDYYKANDGKWVSNYGSDFASKLNELLNASSAVGYYLRNNKREFSDYDSVSKAYSEYRSALDQFAKQNSSMSEFYSQFATDDEYNTWYEDYKRKQEVLTAEDYEEYSQKGAAIENPTYREADGYVNIFGWRPFGEDVGNIVTFSRDNETEIRFGGNTAVGDFRYAHMTDDEVGIYNYYLAKYGKDKANEYLQSIDDELDKREAGQIAKLYNDNVFLESILGFTAGVETSIEGLKSLADFVTGNESGTDYSVTQYADQIIASDNKGILKGFHDVSSVIGGMTPSILASTLTGNPLVGAAMMGGSAMGNAYNEMIDLGYNEWQARGYGLLVGASETTLQYLLGGISKLGGKVTGNAIGNFVSKFDNAIARTAIQLGGNMASEGIEEGLQTVLEPAFKALMTGEEFEAPEWEEVWYSALLGALSAGVMEGVPTIANTAIKSYQANKVYGTDPNALVGEALEIDPDNAHAQRMKAKLNSGEDISGYQLNRLVEANEQALYNQDKSKMSSATEARLTELGETGDVSKLAKALVKQASGESLSLSEKNLLKKSKYGQRVANELSPTNIESGKYDSKWAEGIGTERINTEAYNKSLYDLASEQAGVAVATEEASVTENPTAKENATEAKFEASTDGKTRIGDLEVSIKEIASVKDGEVMLRLEDGSTVNAMDVEFGSSEEGLLYENVANMNLNAATANAFIKGYDHSMSVQEYTLGFREAYRYGEYGIRMNDMSTKGFSAMLSESQKSLAYELGKTDTKYKIEAREKAIAEKASQTASKKKGKVHYAEGILTKNLTQRQQASLKGLETLAEALGVDIYIYESQVVDGKRQGANGWFDRKDGSIHIDLHAGLNGEGTMLFTAAHELTHFIREWSPAKFKVFADFLLEQYGKKGVSVDALVIEQIAKAKRNGRDISYDTAYEEVIADSCEAMLADGDAISKIAKLKAQDKSLWQKIKSFLADLVKKIKAVYEGMTPDSVEGRFVSEMLDTAEKLNALWTEALVEASDAYQASTTTEATEDIVKKDLANKDLLFNLRATESHKKKLSEQYSEDATVSLAELTKRYDKIISIWKRLGGELNSNFLNEWNDKVGKDRAFTVFKAQAGYKYNVELSSMCKKGVPLFEAIDTIVKKEVMKELESNVIGKAEKEILYDILKEHHFEIPCAICYVEQARQREGVIIDAFLNGKIEKNSKGQTTTFKLGWNEVLHEIEKEMKANGVDYTFKAVDRSIATDKYDPQDLTMDEATQEAFYNALKKIANKEITRYNKEEGKKRKLVTSVTPSAIKDVFKGTLPSNLKIFKVLFNDPSSRFTMESDLLYSSMTTHNLAMSHNDLYSLFNSQGGVSGYKTKQGTVVYWGDILGKKWTPSKVRDEGGIRNQSNSDFQMYTLLDQVQMYIDFTAKGYYLQAYTKVLSELKLFGLSRGKINASLIPAVYEYRNADGSVDVETTRLYAGLDKNGNLLFDDIEGINHAEAFMLLEDAEYSKSIGGICIGYSDSHILKLLDDSRVQQIIGFHDKTDDPDKRYRGARYAKNYNGLNEAINNKDGKTVHIGFNPFVRKAEKMFTFNAETETYEGKIKYNGKTYVADDIPKLAADLYLEMCKKKDYTPAYTDFDFHENYYKLLADFSLYDSQGHYAPHRKVAYNMPDQVPYLDLNGNKKYMATEDYIKSELAKELKVRDSIGEALADTSENGIIPQFKKRVNELHKKVNSDDKLLSDRDSYAPTFYSHMGKVVEGIKTEKVGANGVVSYLKGKGVKAEEIKWSGIEAFLEGKKSVTKEELQEFVAGSQLQIEEETSGAATFVDDDGNTYEGVAAFKDAAYAIADKNGIDRNRVKFVIDTDYDMDAYAYVGHPNNYILTAQVSESEGTTPRWSQYKLDGGENYRELVFKMPNSSYSNNAMRGHWGHDAEGVLAHARIQDFDVNGKKMLFIEEIQSDWHNEGHQKGYTAKEYEDAVAVYDKLAEDYANKKRAFNKYVRSGEFRSDPDEVSKKKFDWLRRKMDEAEKRMQAAERDIEALKEKGMGDVPDAPFRNTYHEYVLKRLLRMAAEEGYDSIGWTTADIQSERWSEDYAEGYRIEYDQDIPSFLKKYGKKWGATVGKTALPSLNQKTVAYDINRDEEFVSVKAWKAFVKSELRIQGMSKEDLSNLAFQELENGDVVIAFNAATGIEYDRAEIRKTSDSVWSMDIPDSMKDSVLHDGQALYSLRDVAPVEPTSDKWERTLTTSEVKAMFPNLWDVSADESEVRNPTQISGTVKSYRKVYDFLKRSGFNGTILDASSGLGYGTRAGIEEYGFDVEDIEPYPDKSYSPKYTDYSKLDKQYDVIISNAVLNVIPQDQRDALVVKMGELLKNGGRMFINVRGDDVKNASSKVAINENLMEYYISKSGSYQKGFTKPELVAYLQDALGDGFTVTPITFFGKVSAVVTKNEVKHSDRDTDSVSNRSLLANALESVAQNDVERGKLKQYKEKIALIESEQAKLTEIRAKIKELSFAKGARDTEAIKSLQFEANQAANRINTYDKQLLNLESTKALKDVLQREKEMAYKRAERRGKDALSAYREKAAKTQRELMTRYQESRKKNVEGRHKTAMRHKIKDVVNELNQYLLKGTKDKHVPIELQKAVAEALSAVNMDTVGAEERLAEIHKKLQKDPFDHHLLESYRRISEQGERMDGKLQALKNAYDDIVNSNDPLIANSHDEVISNSIDKVIKEVGSTPLRDMTLAQLESVYDMYKMVLTTIRNTNKAFKAAKSEEISVIANRVMEEIDGLGKKKPYRTKVSQALSKFDWNNLKPVYAFDRIGSNTFTEVFNNVRAGEDTWAVDITEAKNFSLEQHKKFNYDSWDFKKRYGFTSSSGMHFELSLDQIMSLYAYSKREQAKDHLKKGGIVIDETTEVTVKTKLGIPVKFNPTEATAYNLSDETLADIIGKLTTEQKAFVDVMQDYLSTTMGDKGNEVSLALYGVKLYKEKHYFPLKSAQQFMAKAKEQQKGEVKIKNSGFSKETVTKASNPIVLTPFMDVWADHVNEMSMYHAFVLPLEDFYRVYNYKTPTSDTMATESVEMYLQNSYGKGATQYIDQLLKDLNGGARVDSTVGIINKLTGLFKKSAVFASLSVVVQQPSAIARATALVDTKYFVGKPSGKHSETWAEVKKYAPVAVIKEMGYFDTGMGQSTVEWLKGDKTWKDKLDDIASKAPALADELAWCAIWEAVKRETLQTHKDLKYNSDEFLKAVGERFTEVVTKTQVYDSVLSRSANMRSKDTGMKMATAFMGEPTTSLNMLEDALTQGKRGNKRYARKAVGSVVASMILNSILVSFVYAGRDDDEEKTYAEKYIGTLTEELIDSFNPLTLVPFLKDIVSIAQGYDVERSDMAVITDIVNAWNNLENDNRSVYRKVEDFAGAIASLFGLPVKNVMRDARGMYNTVNSFINGEKTTGAGIGVAVKEAVTGKEESNGQQLYDAIISGNTEQTNRVKGRFEDQKAIDSAIRKALRDNDPRIKKAAEARYNGDIAEYMRIAKEIIAEGNVSQDNLVSAINSEINILKKDEGKSESTTSNKIKSIYEMSDYYSALEGRDQATAYVVKEDLIKTDMANGKDRDEAEADFNSKFASHLRDLYEAGDISDSKAEDMLVSYGGKSEEEAFSKVRYWDFRMEYPDYDLSEEAVTKYYNDVESSGIGIDVYYDYSKQRSKCKGTDSDGDGKTDSGSVKSEVLKVINSLPITNTQKDALYYLNGWAASTIWQAPWH